MMWCKIGFLLYWYPSFLHSHCQPQPVTIVSASSLPAWAPLGNAGDGTFICRCRFIDSRSRGTRRGRR